MQLSLKQWTRRFLGLDKSSDITVTLGDYFRGKLSKRALHKIDQSILQGEALRWHLDVDEGYLHLVVPGQEQSQRTRIHWQKWATRNLAPDTIAQIEDALLQYSHNASSGQGPLSGRLDLVETDRHLTLHCWADRDNAQRLNGIALDNSAFHMARLAISTGQSLVEGLINSNLDCVKIIDRNGHLQEMSPGGKVVMAVDDFEAIRESYWPDFWIREEDRQAAINSIETALAGRSSRFTGYTPTMAGEYKWWEVTLHPIASATGRPEELLSVSRDITAERLATEQLSELKNTLEQQVLERTQELVHQQELNKLLLDTVSEGVVACDENGELILFNETAREWHGMDPRKIPPAEWAHHYCLYDADGLTPLNEPEIPLIRAFHGEQVTNAGMTITRSGHAPRHILASGGPIFDDDGNKIGAVVTMRDITHERENKRSLERAAGELRAANVVIKQERELLEQRVALRTRELNELNAELEKARESAEAASKSKSAFLATMSHEIRTPMNGVVGMLDVLASEPLSDSQQDSLTTIRESSFMLLRLIDDILDFSKIEAGKMQLEQTPVNLRNLLENVCTLLTPFASDNNVLLSPYVDPAVPECVLADSTRLQQIFYNVIGNAVKYSGINAGKPGLVGIHIQPAGTDPGHIEIKVTDNGIGIPEHIIPTLFSSFTQAESSTTRKFGGTGLGLVITRRLASLMGGSVELVSEEGKGTTVTLNIPFEPGKESRIADLDDIPCQIVSDNVRLTEKLVGYLTLAGCDVVDTRPSVNTDQNATVEATLLLSGKDDDKVTLEIALARKHGLNDVGGGRFRLESPFLSYRELVNAIKVCAGLKELEAALHSSVKPREIIKHNTLSSGEKILVVEDDKTNQDVLRQQLMLLNLASDIACNGREALELFKNNAYSLIITDVNMPELDGYEMTQLIREHESKNRLNRTPILALSANAIVGESSKALSVGLDAYLVKPIQLAALASELERWLPTTGTAPKSVSLDNSPEAKEVLVIEKLHAVISDDPTRVQAALSSYQDSTKNVPCDINQAIAQGQLTKAASLAHRLKGSSATIGGIRLSKLCSRFEACCKENSPDALERRRQELHAEYTRLRSAIDRHLESLKWAAAS